MTHADFESLCDDAGQDVEWEHDPAHVRTGYLGTAELGRTRPRARLPVYTDTCPGDVMAWLAALTVVG